MKVAYISDIQISSLVGEETWLNESFDYFSSIMAQFISRYSDTIDYLILNGGIYSDSTRFLEFVDFLDTSFKSHNIHTKVLFNVSNIEYYSNSVFVDKVGQFYDTDKKFKNHRLYLPRNPIITKDTWIFGVDTWYDYSLYRGKPISLKDITKKDNRGFFGKLFNKRVNLDNFNITDESDYAFGLQNTFDVKHTNDCVDSFRHICDRYDRTIAQPTNKVACGYFYSNALFLSDNPKRDGTMMLLVVALSLMIHLNLMVSLSMCVVKQVLIVVILLWMVLCIGIVLQHYVKKVSLQQIVC